MPSYSVDDDPAVALISDSSTYERDILLENQGASTVYIDTTSGVTSSTGFPLLTGSSVSFTVKGEQTIYGICASTGTATVKSIEI